MSAIDYGTLKALFLLCFITGVTPGPNNTILLSTSVQYGVKKALPCYFGIALGFPLMVLAVTALITSIGDHFIQYLNGLKYLGSAFLFYLAYGLFTAKPRHRELNERPPVSMLQMMTFQWINPKAWAMIASAITLVPPSQIFLPSTVFQVTALITGLVWLLPGDLIRRFILGTPLESYINKVLAILLVLSIYYLF